MTQAIDSTNERLRSFVDRLVRLHEERKSLADDISDLLKEAAGTGFDKAALKAVVKRAMKDSAADEAEQHQLVEIYWTNYQGLVHAHVRERAA
jgi:uncharacterized protein (UPF0335 family)